MAANARKAIVQDLSDYRDRLAGLPPEKFIGVICWFSIAGTDGHPVRVNYDQLVEWFSDLSLDKSVLPPEIGAVNAFRRATASQSGWEYSLSDGRVATLMIREVTSNENQVVRNVVKEIRDAKNQKLTYEARMAVVKFIRARRTNAGQVRGSESFQSQLASNLSPQDKTEVEALVQRARDTYTDLSTNLHGDAIRAIIRTHLTRLNAIAVKPTGGVYFVHSSRQPQTDALAELIKRIGQGCTFHMLPLLDTLSQREMLTEAFQSEVEEKVEHLLKDIASMNEKAKKRGRGSKVSAEEYASLNATYQEVESRAAEYTKVLGLAMGRAGAALEVALESVMDMSGRIDFKQ